MPNGIYTRREAKYKVYETIQNINIIVNMRPFRTSLTDIYSYGTTVHMSILSSRFMRLVRIMPTSRLVRATGSH